MAALSQLVAASGASPGATTRRRARSVPPAFVGRGCRLSGDFSDTISEVSSSLDAAAGYASALKVIGRRCALFDRPARADIRRVAAWDIGLHERSFSVGRSASGVSSRAHRLLACGLSEHEVVELLYREITPEDYDLLLLLDEMVPKKTLAPQALEKLQVVRAGQRRHDSCGICLMPWQDGEEEEEEDIVSVPCPAAHEFHRSCVTKWLTQCKNSCPVDHAALWAEGEET